MGLTLNTGTLTLIGAGYDAVNYDSGEGQKMLPLRIELQLFRALYNTGESLAGNVQVKAVWQDGSCADVTDRSEYSMDLSEPLTENGTITAYFEGCSSSADYYIYDEAAPQLLKLAGSIDTVIEHSHAGENPSVTDNSGKNYTYGESGAYRVKGAFSMTIRCHGQSGLACPTTMATIPAATHPLNTKTEPLVFPYDWSTAPLYPPTDGVHPLLGQPSMNTYYVRASGGALRKTISIELIMYLDVSAPKVCPWDSDMLYIGLGYPVLDAKVTPLKSFVDEVPGDVNGWHGYAKFKGDTYYYQRFYHVGASSSKSIDILATRKISTNGTSGNADGVYDGSQTGRNGLLTNGILLRGPEYEIPYHIQGTRNGAPYSGEKVYRQKFNLIYIPITQRIYSGAEANAPESALHPSREDEIFKGMV